MEKLFLNVLHEEEKMDDMSLENLKGGRGDICIGKDSNCKHSCSGSNGDNGQQ
ncbi:MAG: hypothetical protein IJV34_01780 [Prevotella sp.]|nr:hypothetical protein [Prevotella sp.]